MSVCCDVESRREGIVFWLKDCRRAAVSLERLESWERVSRREGIEDRRE